MALTREKLILIEYQLTDRDKEILRALRDAKCLFTYHIRRLFYHDAKNVRSGARSTQHALKRLKEYGLIDVMVDRRIGGVRAGSSSYIWYLTEQGNRLLNLDQKHKDDTPKRTRFLEPADSTLGHRMAISECFVKLCELEQNNLLSVKEVTFEPNNWHYFTFKGKNEILKPDLSIVTAHDGYEYRFFIEIDLSTESVDTVLRKCIRYHKYLQTEIEQNEHGVFPVVLFIVKDEKRKSKLEHAIRTHLKNHPNIFLFITADDYDQLMTTITIPSDKLC